MGVMRCDNCEKELTKDMEIEYSRWLSRYFCHPDCATDYYFNEMESEPFDPTDRKDELEERGIKIVDGKLYKY